MESPVTVTGCAGNASATATVEVHIVHTYIGDLVVSLIAPDGSTYVLHNRAGGSADNINQTYTVNLSSEPANGTWKLRVQDAAGGDIGRIDSWTINLGAGPSPTPDPTSTVTGPDGMRGDQRQRRADPGLSQPWNRRSPSRAARGNPSATATVEVHIVHTYIGDLIVTLIAPDGSSLPAAQPRRRQHRQHQPDLHRQPVIRAGQRHLEAARPGRRRRRHRPHRLLDHHPVATRRDALSAH